jgi:hypothetical protein
VLTPEDPYPVWEGAGHPVTVAPLFLLYDYSFRPPMTSGKADGLARAYAAGVVCSDEWLLHPDPYPSREAWCEARIELTRRLLAARVSDLPVVLMNHFPLVREPTRVLRYPEFAMWCGIERTADWHVRFKRPSLSTVISIFREPRGTMACGSKRCRWATRGNGKSDRKGRVGRVRCFRPLNGGP